MKQFNSSNRQTSDLLSEPIIVRYKLTEAFPIGNEVIAIDNDEVRQFLNDVS